jgi:hypothetical protein
MSFPFSEPELQCVTLGRGKRKNLLGRVRLLESVDELGKAQFKGAHWREKDRRKNNTRQRPFEHTPYDLMNS